MLSLETAYENTNERSAYKGIIIRDGFYEYLSSRVKTRFYDIEGTESLIDEFKGIASTGFEEEFLINIFSTYPYIEDWKIGEALAECYLEDYEKARFYYPSSRDSKNPKANLQGADLVGFVEVNEETTIFLFGEVKTSSDKKSPPQVMLGRTGMKEQLNNLNKDKALRNSLIKWLGFKVKTLSDDDPFKKDYQKALKVYLKEESEHKYFLFGVLVRSTDPKDTDLKSKYETLKNDLLYGAHLKLIALYIPISLKDMKDYIIDSGKER